MGDGTALKIQLVRHSITQSELARRLGVSRSSVSTNLQKERLAPETLLLYRKTVADVLEERERIKKGL